MLKLFKKYWFGIISIALIAISIPGTVYLANTKTSFFGIASPEEAPQEVKITNISDNSFSVTWVTPDKQTTGFVSFGETSRLGNVASEDRGSTARYTHHVTVKNTKPSTNYYFKIGSQDNEYDNEGAPFQIKTAPTTNDPPPLADPAYGKVVGTTGSPAPDAIIYLTVAGGTPLSSYTRQDGNWLITLNNARTADLSTYVSYKESGERIELLVNSGPNGSSRAQGDTNNDSPFPSITLGTNIDLGSAGSTPKPLPSPSSNPSFSLQEVDTVKEATQSSISINPIGTSNQTNDFTPSFSGTGTPGETITITVNSTTAITAQVIVGADGKWTYTPIQQLEPGEHSILIAQGGQTTSQSFSVLGTSTSATGSARVALPATSSGTPTAGAFENTLLMLLAGIIFVITGAVISNKRN